MFFTVSPVAWLIIHEELLEHHNEGLYRPLLPAHLVPGHDEPHDGVPPDLVQLCGHLLVELRAAHQDQLQTPEFPLSGNNYLL